MPRSGAERAALGWMQLIWVGLELLGARCGCLGSGGYVWGWVGLGGVGAPTRYTPYHVPC